jgi:hypothetical protein
VNTIHNIQEATTVEDMGITHAYLDDRQEEYQSNMIEVEGKIINQPVAILIDSGASHCYIDPKIVDRLHLEKTKLGKSSLVQLATRTKRRMDTKFEWAPKCEYNFNLLKELLTSAPVLKIADPNESCVVCTNACKE